MSTRLTFPKIQQSSFPISISYENISLKSRKENGDYKLRKKFTNARKTFTLKWNAMSSEDYQTLESFYINDCQTNVKKFLWKYPSVKSNIRTRYDIFNNRIFICRFDSFNAKASEHNSYIVEVVLNGIEYFTKLVPVLSLGEWTKDGEISSADITYDGDGQLSIEPDISASIDNQWRLIISNPDGVPFKGIVKASEGDYYVDAFLEFEFAEGIPIIKLGGECYTYLDMLERQIPDYNQYRGILVNNYNNVYYLLFEGSIYPGIDKGIGLLSSANLSENGDLYSIRYHYLSEDDIFVRCYKNQELFYSVDFTPYRDIVIQAQKLLPPTTGLNNDPKFISSSDGVIVRTIWSCIDDEDNWAVIFLVDAGADYHNKRARLLGRGTDTNPDFSPVLGNVSVSDVYQAMSAHSCIEVFYLLTPNNVTELFRWHWCIGVFNALSWYEYTGDDDIDSHWDPSNWYRRNAPEENIKRSAKITSIPSDTKIPLPNNFYYIVDEHSPLDNEPDFFSSGTIRDSGDSLFNNGVVGNHDLYSIYRTVVTISLFSPDNELVFNGEISMFFQICAIKIDKSKYLVNFLNPIKRDYVSNYHSVYDAYIALEQAHPNLMSEGLYICENGEVKEKLLDTCLNQHLRVMNNIEYWQDRIIKKSFKESLKES